MRAVALAAAAALAFVACAPSGSAGSPTGVELTLFGAASLRTALAEVTEAYRTSNPGVAFVVSIDSSAALAAQIEQGAPADVFLAADTTSPARLLDAGRAVGPAVTFATNRLTVIVPKDNPTAIATPADLARPGVAIIAAADAVPITRYAREVVENLADQAGYPPDFTEGYARNVVSREDNVAAVVTKIELGEGDAAIVYATDAQPDRGVEQIPIPATANVSARYDGVVVAGSPNRGAARAFLEWLAGPAGQAILAQLGFGSP